MNLRNSKGVTGIDLSVALIIITLFTGIISTLIYNFTISSKSVNRTAIATNIIISKIEELKQEEYDNLLEGENTEYRYEDGTIQESDLTQKKAPYKVTTTITKYANSNYVTNLTDEEKEKLQDIIKIVKVTVQYSVGTRNESVDLSTVITKEI